MSNKGFSILLKIDFVDSPEEDAEIAKDPKSTIPGSYWQWSVSEIKDR